VWLPKEERKLVRVGSYPWEVVFVAARDARRTVLSLANPAGALACRGMQVVQGPYSAAVD